MVRCLRPAEPVTPEGLKKDLEGIRLTKDGSLNVKLFVL